MNTYTCVFYQVLMLVKPSWLGPEILISRHLVRQNRELFEEFIEMLEYLHEKVSEAGNAPEDYEGRCFYTYLASNYSQMTYYGPDFCEDASHLVEQLNTCLDDEVSCCSSVFISGPLLNLHHLLDIFTGEGVCPAWKFEETEIRDTERPYHAGGRSRLAYIVKPQYDEQDGWFVEITDQRGDTHRFVLTEHTCSNIHFRGADGQDRADRAWPATHGLRRVAVVLSRGKVKWWGLCTEEPKPWDPFLRAD